MFPYLAMALKTVICLLTVSVSYLRLHQEFYLIKIQNYKNISYCKLQYKLKRNEMIQY